MTFARIIELPSGTPQEQGRAHGEAHRAAIHELAALRTELAVAQGKYANEAEVLRVAGAHVTLLEGWEPDLAAELVGIAEGADLDPARVVVLNHYTDLKDIDPANPFAPSPAVSGDEDCSAVVAGTASGPVLGQTWDMHGSAEPFVAMLHVPARGEEPEAWLFTLVGCLGMTGLNSAGVGCTINNLKSHDARVGVVWPALVRRMLRERTTADALEILRGAPLASGHHYLLASAEEAYGVETSGVIKDEVFHARWADAPGAAYLHTNHCVGEVAAPVSWHAETSTTLERYAWLTASLAEAPIADRHDLWRRLGSHDGYPRSVCTHLSRPEAPHAMKTCGGLVMDLAANALYAYPGCIHEQAPIAFPFSGAA